MKQKHLLALLQTGFTTIQVQFPRGEDDVSAPRSVKVPRTPPPPAPWDVPVQPMQQVKQTQQPFPLPPGYDAQPAPNPNLKTYTYKARGQIAVGDSVVVETSRGLCVANVVGVDAAPRLDLDSDLDYKWIVQRVDRTEYDKAQYEEQEFADTLQHVEAIRQREELMNTMAAHLPPGTQARAMFDAAIARAAQVPVLPTAVNASPAPAAVAPQREEGMQCK